MPVQGWFTSVDGSGHASWASEVFQPEADLVCTYTVVSTLTDNITDYWGPPNDGPYNIWFALAPTVTSLDSATQDGTLADYRILGSVTHITPTIAYDVVSDVGFITGSATLPFASAERDLVDTYNVPFAGVEKDFTDTYRVVTYVEDFITEIYNIKNSAERDLTDTYNSGGYVELAYGATYDVVISVERDSTTDYNVIGSAERDAVITFTVVTNPLSAAREQIVTYEVLNQVTRDSVDTYNVLTQATRDLVEIYRVLRTAEKDTVVTYDLSGQTLNDTTVTYQVFARTSVESNAIFGYDIDSLLITVPNIVGYSLPKATKVLEQNNLVLGQVTYN